MRALGRALRAADRAHGQPGRARRGAARRRRASAASWSPTASTRSSSTRARSTAARSGAGTSSRPAWLGARRPRRAPSATRTTWCVRRRRPCCSYVGRFTAVKRIPLLIEAYGRHPGLRPARRRSCFVGGFPGEWEGEHPLETVIAARARATSSSPAGTTTTSCRTSSPPPTPSSCRACASSSGRCSSRAWPAGCPPIAVDAHGPAEIVEHGETGWLVRARRPRRRWPRCARGGRQPPAERRRAGRGALERRPRALRLAGPRRAGRRGLRRCRASGQRPAVGAAPWRRGATLGGLAMVAHSSGRLERLSDPRRAPIRRPGPRLMQRPQAPHRAGRPLRPGLRARRLRRRLRRPPRRRAVRTRRWTARSSRSRTSSTAGPRAPTPTRATAPGSCCRSPTSSSAASCGEELPPAGAYGVGVCLPARRTRAQRERARGLHRHRGRRATRASASSAGATSRRTRTTAASPPSTPPVRQAGGRRAPPTTSPPTRTRSSASST